MPLHEGQYFYLFRQVIEIEANATSRQMVDGPAFVETGHLDRIFHRRSFTVDAQRSLAVLSNGDDATVNLRCEPTVYRYLCSQAAFRFASVE
jgi:hypothetical protein